MSENVSRLVLCAVNFRSLFYLVNVSFVLWANLGSEFSKTYGGQNMSMKTQIQDFPHMPPWLLLGIFVHKVFE